LVSGRLRLKKKLLIIEASLASAEVSAGAVAKADQQTANQGPVQILDQRHLVQQTVLQCNPGHTMWWLAARGPWPGRCPGGSLRAQNLQSLQGWGQEF
jgi:hypothetical protein